MGLEIVATSETGTTKITTVCFLTVCSLINHIASVAKFLAAAIGAKSLLMNRMIYLVGLDQDYFHMSPTSNTGNYIRDQNHHPVSIAGIRQTGIYQYASLPHL